MPLILLSQKVADAEGFALVAELLGCFFVIREVPRHARLDRGE